MVDVSDDRLSFSNASCLTRAVSPKLDRCELTHAVRVPIDVELAAKQHADYEDALRRAGATVRRLDPLPDNPDGVFVEDTALVLPEVGVILRPGAASRRAEVESVAAALAEYGAVRSLEPPGTVDGGDVLRVGRTLHVGISSRTGRRGLAQLAEIVSEFGYEVSPVLVDRCLHLKSAVTQVGPGLLLANRSWIPDMDLDTEDVIDVAPDEPDAANALWIGEHVVYPSNFPRTAERLADRGVRLILVDVSEIQKAEGGVTCCCLPISRPTE